MKLNADKCFRVFLFSVCAIWANGNFIKMWIVCGKYKKINFERRSNKGKYFMAKKGKSKIIEEPTKLTTSFEELFNMSTTYVPMSSVVNKKARPKKAAKKK